MRQRLLLRLLCVTAMVCLTTPIFAQPGGGRGGRGGFGGFGGGRGPGGGTPSTVLPLTQLLRVEAVREEIEIMPDQAEALTKLGERERGGERPDFNSIREMSEEERTEFITKMRKQAEERNKEAHVALEQILLPPQMDRLNEIAIQRAGTAALYTTHVIDELKITKAQQEKLKEARTKAEEKVREQMQELFAGLRGGGERGQGGENTDRESMRARFEELRKKGEELRKDVEKDVMAVLTSAQRSEFEKMKGKEFEMPERTFGGRGGQGGRGGRGGQGGRGGDQGGRRPARPAAE